MVYIIKGVKMIYTCKLKRVLYVPPPPAPSPLSISSLLILWLTLLFPSNILAHFPKWWYLLLSLVPVMPDCTNPLTIKSRWILCEEHCHLHQPVFPNLLRNSHFEINWLAVRCLDTYLSPPSVPWLCWTTTPEMVCLLLAYSLRYPWAELHQWCWVAKASMNVTFPRGSIDWRSDLALTVIHDSKCWFSVSNQALNTPYILWCNDVADVG